MSPQVSEADLEDVVLGWLRELGYSVVHGPRIAPGEPAAERTSFADVVLVGRLRAAIARINPKIPPAALEDAEKKLLRSEHPTLIENNRRFHRFLTDGIPVEYRQPDGTTKHDQVWLIDFARPERNDWAAVNQFTVIENRIDRRADVVVFVNGLPLGVLELKKPGTPSATIRGAFNQLQTYQAQIPSLFATNEVFVVSDGFAARIGAVSSDWQRFMPWRTIDGKDILPKNMPEVETLIRGVFEKQRFLDLIRGFVVFESDGGNIIKKLAGYHQFHAVNKAVGCTVKATAERGDRRVGVIWHTQGSGKSLSMVFYAGKVVQHSAMENPTIVVITDRSDLDEQLFGTFSRCHELLRQKPTQAESRADLRERLKVASGGIIFTTVQKFLPEEKGDKFPELSNRRNIVVIADEAHRSQYDFIDGFARHLHDALPNASYLGFTGTPIEAADKNTRQVFGDYIDVYDIERAVEDGTTVPIYYEGRLAKIQLDDAERPRIDPAFEELTETEELSTREMLKSKWARLEAMVGAEKRIALVAQDIVEHFDHRREGMEGKGLIVAMSRRICVDLYAALVKLRPNWDEQDDTKGFLKVVMTGSASDPLPWQPHIGNKERRELVARRFKDANDPLKLVIVRDMWLTGFDVPSLHTMYVDKPMRGHGLMQAIARVNRVFKDKPGGLVVDYLGLAEELKNALSEYSERDRQLAGVPQEEALEALLEKYEVVVGMYHGFDYAEGLFSSGATRLLLMRQAMDHILGLDEGKRRYLRAVNQLGQAFALAVPQPRALVLRDEIRFFQEVRAGILKMATDTDDDRQSPEDLDAAVRQLVSRAVASEDVVDIFAAAGLKKPDISILSEEFLAEIRGLPQKNVALEALRKLLTDELDRQKKTRLVQSRAFSEMLDAAILKYQNRSLEAAAVITELIDLAREMRAAHGRGEQLGLNEAELAFYDALETNDSAVKVLGDEVLKVIARDLVQTVRQNTSIDWTLKESVRANLRRLIRRILKKHGYPPDKQEKAIVTVLEQAELLGLELTT